MRALPLFLLLAGCPDPTATPEGASSSGQPTDAAPPPGGPGAPGAPGEGGPMGGPPGGAPPQGVPAGRPTPTGFKAEAGNSVKIQGDVAYAGSKTGTLRVDFLRQAQNAAFPELVESVTLEKPGHFEVEAPKNAGDFWVVAYLDAGDNGPDPGEPAGRISEQLKVGDKDPEPLKITIEDNPDLGKLKPISDGAAPTGAPPGGAGMGAPPLGGAPPAGAPPMGAPPAGAPSPEEAAKGAPPQ